MPPARPAFRTDLEGLRGFAILLVVLFHAGVSGFAGGFVGVDVFFVLSGYFITAMLFREIADEGRVDATAFWGRRALRLLPALLLVLMATLAAVMFLYAPIDRAPIAGTARSVALYSGNIAFANGSVDYFSSGENPFLHTWSLAVEEQFYIVWPMLFLLVAWVYERKWIKSDAVPSDASDDIARKRLLIGIALAGAASFALSLSLTRGAQPWAFFGMPTRIWEFALGGCLALSVLPYVETSTIVTRGIVLQALGLVAIVFAVLTYDRVTPYPGFAALTPAFGAAALIVGGARAPDSAVSRGLSAAWLQWLGRMSYAWYLWHWPLVGLGAVIDWDIGVPGKLVWSAVALVLAWLTNRYVEAPARGDGRLARMPRAWVAPAALAVSVAVAIVAHLAMRSAERQVSSGVQKAFAAARSDRMDHECWGTTIEAWRGPCEFGDVHGSRTLVLMGDSHAEHWLGALDRAGKEHGWKVVAFVKGGCPVAEMPEMLYPRLKRFYHECTRFREAMLQRIVTLKPDAAILSSWDHYMSLDGKKSDWQVTPEAWEGGLRNTYARLAQAGVRTIAIRGTPRTWFDAPACLSRRAARLPFAPPCVYPRSRGLSSLAVAAQNRAASGLPVTFIDMNDQICATAQCPVVKNGFVVFTDDNHLTRSFSRSLAPVIGERIAGAMR